MFFYYPLPCALNLSIMYVCVFTRNEASQDQLINHCKAVAEHISSLVTSVRSSISNSENPSAQLGLINSSQAIIAVCSH